LQQGFGDRQNALAMEGLTVSELETFYFVTEGNFQNDLRELMDSGRM
jgi:hypothetical protein